MIFGQIWLADSENSTRLYTIAAQRRRKRRKKFNYREHWLILLVVHLIASPGISMVQSVYHSTLAHDVQNSKSLTLKINCVAQTSLHLCTWTAYANIDVAQQGIKLNNQKFHFELYTNAMIQSKYIYIYKLCAPAHTIKIDKRLHGCLDFWSLTRSLYYWSTVHVFNICEGIRDRLLCINRYVLCIK